MKNQLPTIAAILFALTLTYSPLLMANSNEGLNPKRERLFHCMNFGKIKNVEELYVVKSRLGSNIFYEVEVPYKTFENQAKTYFKKLILTEKYGGRILTYSTGNTRVKIDRAIPVEKKYKSFVRLPKFDIHSKEWKCKDY